MKKFIIDGHIDVAIVRIDFTFVDKVLSKSDALNLV